MSSRAAQKRASRLVREQLARERRRRRSFVTSILAVALLVVAGVIGFVVYTTQRPSEAFRVPMTATADRAGL